MIQAIIDQRKHWCKDNTRVEFDPVTDLSRIFLHGHWIGEYDHNNMGLAINNQGYETNTTKSRLNALINFVCDPTQNGIFQKDWNWFITKDGETEDFPSGAWYTV